MRTLKIIVPMIVGAFISGCATLNAPVKQIKPNRENFFNTFYENKDLNYVLKDNGAPGSQGHWGAGEHSFMLVYPIGLEGEMPTWKFNLIKKNETKSLRCYIFLFDKRNGHKFSSLKEDDCFGFGNEPDRVDWTYTK